MLFNEPKLLKSIQAGVEAQLRIGFSALQRAEIAEMRDARLYREDDSGFSALQRAEIAEIVVVPWGRVRHQTRFSALQRAEIAEIHC